MIKINKYLYIHFTALLLFAVCYINRNLDILAVNYTVIFLHELAHTAAACVIGLKPSHITFLPFGVNLKLKNNIVFSLADEIILYFAGPLFNVLAALLCIPFLKYHFIMLFYRCNIVLFLFNMIPILPMDGAIIIKKIFTQILGSKKAEIILKAISAVFIISLLILEILLYFYKGFDFSVLFMIIFLTANIFTNKEKYYMDFVKELMFYKSKSNFKIKKAKSYVIKESADYRSVAKNFAKGYYYIIFKENNQGGIKEILTERDIIEKILK